MDTINFLNIKSDSSDAITGQALAMISADKKNADSFKSSFKDQVEKKRNEQSRSEKGLPQNGNDLPKKKIAIEKNDKPHQSDSDEPDNIINTDQRLTLDKDNARNDVEQTRQSNHSDDKSDTNKSTQPGTEQENSSVATNSSENLDSDEHTNTQEQLNQLLSETIGAQTELTAAELQAKTNEQNLITQQIESESRIAAELNEARLTKPVNADTEKLSSEKIIQAAITNKQLNPGHVVSNSNIISDSATKIAMNSAAENKNESLLSKGIADFQQFIEMSKKHSMAGETIASVKAFEQTLKTEQLNVQALLADTKLSSSQNSSAQSGQTVIPSILSVKTGSVLNNPALSLSQSIAALEVKTGVGKAGWNQSFANQIVMMAKNGIQEAKIKLNPMRLGPVEAMVRLSGESAVVNLSSLHLTTKDAMENALPRLKEMLNENGFSQVDVNVSHQGKQQQEAALANQDSKTGSNNEHGNSTMPGDEQLSEETLDSEADAQVSELDEQGLNIVDYYA